MSVCIQVNLICDFCGADHDSVDISVGLARETAREDGWRRRRIDGQWRDICWECLHPQADADVREELAYQS